MKDETFIKGIKLLTGSLWAIFGATWAVFIAFNILLSILNIMF